MSSPIDSDRKFITEAILKNEFLHNIAKAKLTTLVDCMYPVVHKASEMVIIEGDNGYMVYVMIGKLIGMPALTRLSSFLEFVRHSNGLAGTQHTIYHPTCHFDLFD